MIIISMLLTTNKNMKKILLILCLCLFTQACSTTKNAEVIYSRSDIKTEVSAVIVFPTITPNIEINDSTKLVSGIISSKWTGVYGKKAIPADPIMAELLKNKTSREYLGKLVSALDSTSGIEQILKDANIQKFVQELTSKLGAAGNTRLALSIMYGDEKSYNSGAPLYINVGLFDVKGLTWKVITKTESVKGKLGNFKLDAAGIASEHFASITTNLEEK